LRKRTWIPVRWWKYIICLRYGREKITRDCPRRSILNICSSCLIHNSIIKISMFAVSSRKSINSNSIKLVIYKGTSVHVSIVYPYPIFFFVPYQKSLQNSYLTHSYKGNRCFHKSRLHTNHLGIYLHLHTNKSPDRSFYLLHIPLDKYRH